MSGDFDSIEYFFVMDIWQVDQSNAVWSDEIENW